MSYNKPELVVSGSSVQLIQGNNKGLYSNPDNLHPTTEFDATSAAYEADE